MAVDFTWVKHVHRRPGMYIGSTNGIAVYHMLVNLVEQMLLDTPEPHTSQISIHLQRDESIIVTATGSVTLPTTIKSPLVLNTPAELITALASTLHRPDELKLHALPLFQAFARRCIIHMYQHGQHFLQSFAKGKPLHTARQVDISDQTGMRIEWKPNLQLLSELNLLSSSSLAQRLSVVAARYPGTRIQVTDERVCTYQIQHNNGLRDYLLSNPLNQPSELLQFVGTSTEVRLEFVWLTYHHTLTIESWVNYEPTPEHGSHVEGFWRGMQAGFGDYARAQGWIAKRARIGRDRLPISGKLLITVDLLYPKYAGATRNRLNDERVLKAVTRLVRGWLCEQLAQPDIGTQLASRLKAALER
jgi:DNA gyrase/topoisomerase IV subunit B